MDAMTENLGTINAAVSLLIKAALLAARFSGRVRKQSLKRLAAMDADAKAKEILFLKDRVYQLETQVSILQKQLAKRGKNPRYTVRERLSRMPAFQRAFTPSLTATRRSDGRLTGETVAQKRKKAVAPKLLRLPYLAH